MIIRGIESVTRNTTVAKVFKNVSQQQGICFKIKIALFSKGLNREPLPHVGGMRVINLGYDIANELYLSTNYKTIRAAVNTYPPTFRRSQCTRTERCLFVSVD